jgi:hypothetical protein
MMNLGLGLGLLLIGGLCRQCPEVLEVEGLDAKDKRGNLKRALRLLRRKWGVPKLVGTPPLPLCASSLKGQQPTPTIQC